MRLTRTQRAVFECLASGGVIRHRSTPTSAFGKYTVFPIRRPCFSVTAGTVDALRKAGLLVGEDISLQPGLTQPRYIFWAKGTAAPDELRRSN